MATTNHRAASATPAPLASVLNTNGIAHSHTPHDDSLPNSHHVHVQEPRPAPTPTPAMASNAAKKGKGKKTLDSNEASKLVAARISQLEVDTAAEKEQEAEIGRFFFISDAMMTTEGLERGETFEFELRDYTTAAKCSPIRDSVTGARGIKVKHQTR